MIPIIDLHCDLLCYLEKDSSRTPFDAQVRCSLPQLTAGNVKLQVMAVFADTGKGSSLCGNRQMNILIPLPRFERELTTELQTLLAIENASALLDEEEPLQFCFDRIDRMSQRPLYIGMTWNPENRFGGGAATGVGLKPDGKALLHFLSGRGIAVDFSHASDALVEGILDEIDRAGLDIPVMASHSNSRSVYDIPRNLPDCFVKEIASRGGVIGINYVTRLLGTGGEPLMTRHLDHFFSLGVENHLAIGSDFFYCDDWAAALKMNPAETFYAGYDSAACHQRALHHYREAMGLTSAQVEKLAYGNAYRFIKERYGQKSGARREGESNPIAVERR